MMTDNPSSPLIDESPRPRKAHRGRRGGNKYKRKYPRPEITSSTTTKLEPQNVVWTSIPLSSSQSATSTTQTPDEILGGEWEFEPVLPIANENGDGSPPQSQPIPSCLPRSLECGPKEDLLHPAKPTSEVGFCLVDGDELEDKPDPIAETSTKSRNSGTESELQRSENPTSTSTTNHEDSTSKPTDEPAHGPDAELLRQQLALMDEQDKDLKELQEIFAHVARTTSAHPDLLDYDDYTFEWGGSARRRDKEARKEARRCNSKSLLRWVRHWWGFLSTTKRIRLGAGTEFDRQGTMKSQLLPVGTSEETEDDHRSIPGTFPHEQVFEYGKKRASLQRNLSLAEERCPPMTSEVCEIRMNRELERAGTIVVAKKMVRKIDGNGNIIRDPEANEDEETLKEEKEENTGLSPQSLGVSYRNEQDHVPKTGPQRMQELEKRLAGLHISRTFGDQIDITDFHVRERASMKQRALRKAVTICARSSFLRLFRHWWLFLSTTNTTRIIPGAHVGSGMSHGSMAMETDRLLPPMGDRRDRDDVGVDEKFETRSVPGTFPQEPISDSGVKRVFSKRNPYLAEGRCSLGINGEGRESRNMEIAGKRIVKIDDFSSTVTPCPELEQHDEGTQAKEEKTRLSEQRLGGHFEEFEHDIFAQKSKIFLASIEVEGGEEDDEDDESVFEEAKLVQDPTKTAGSGKTTFEQGPNHLERWKFRPVEEAEWMAKRGDKSDHSSNEKERGRSRSRSGALARATGREAELTSCSLSPVSKTSKVPEEIVMHRARLDRIR